MHRLASTRPGVMMPEIGRSTVDHEGESLIRAWILSLKGNCDIVSGAPAGKIAPLKNKTAKHGKTILGHGDHDTVQTHA